MSALDPHVRAFRILSEEFREQRPIAGHGEPAMILAHMAEVYSRAADRLEQSIRDEIAANSSACTIDHKTMGAAICPACGVRKGGK